ncbi:uncharacterized protein TNCT_131651 [Trichonephila clavata]|uniref:Uncharacterized protein n=1 Tax=Trichonephila clavata TaxID=2740835 RepID=A0A8X6G337_TRICU|nr:uncharacterized protein TNCT_131651 [Trichonephila clavata]
MECVHDYFTIDVKGLMELDTSKPITKRIVLQSADLKNPRIILDSSGDSSDVQIPTFSDPSQESYKAAAFLSAKYKDRISVDLVTSKSRIAPLKNLSLPRLKLMGAIFAARLAKEVKKIIDQKCSTKAFFWKDSQITLY